MKSILSSILLVSLFISQAFTQTPKATISGHVTDTDGAAVTSATITIKNTATGFQARTSSDQEGRFVFKDVDHGEYEVAFEAGGFKRRITFVLVVLPQTVVVDVRLEHGVATKSEKPSINTNPGEKSKARSEAPVAGGAAPPEPNRRIVRIFYATDRKRSNSSRPADFYSGERGPEDRLSYGTCEVSIPRDHRMGVLEAPSVTELEFNYDAQKHVTVLRIDEKDRGGFFSELQGRISSSNDKQAFVFIHGYNVSFQEAACRTAQLSYDLGFHGAPILYSWPSRARTISYGADEATVEWTSAHLRNFLEDIAAKSGASTVHLIAHSMGNRALTNALRVMASELKTGQLRPFRQVILAAPDIDIGIFKQLAEAIQKTCEKVTLYASSRDKALYASAKIHHHERAGQTHPKVTVVPGIDTIDASALDTGFLGHSYFAENTSIITDIIRIFQSGKTPGERCGMKPNRQTNPLYWVFDRAIAASCPML